MNFSDGLDGLAGGMALLALVSLMLLSYRVGAADIALICIVLAGGLLGFLLYNSHPAQVFMGEIGSQFLGYSLAVLTIYLTQGKTHIQRVYAFITDWFTAYESKLLHLIFLNASLLL